MRGNPWEAFDEATLHSPRLLCLHGGGTNAEIMKLQCRSLIRELCPHFRLVYADAPFLCAAHPDVIPVYAEYGPYRRWLRWQQVQPEVDDDVVVSEIEYQIRTAMEADNRLGATGEWVGLLGFSQGAKVVASMLYESQLRIDEIGTVAPASKTNGASAKEAVQGFAGGKWKFGVCIAGRAPLVTLREGSKASPGLASAGSLSEMRSPPDESGIDRLRLPTIHVHGLKDAGLPFHRTLLHEYCEPDTTQLVEWDGEHRIPLKSSDISPIVDAIMRVSKVRRAVGCSHGTP